jgi:hypothetical protein
MLNFYRLQDIGGAFKQRVLATPEQMGDARKLDLVTPLSVETPLTLCWYLLTPKAKNILDTYKEHGLTLEHFDDIDTLIDEEFQKKLYQLRFNL